MNTGESSGPQKDDFTFWWQSIVFRLDIPAMRKLVALAAADFSAKDGTRIFPSQKKIADMCNIKEDTVMRHLKALRALGMLTRVARGGGRGGSTDLYRMTVPDMSTLPLHLDPSYDRIPDGAEYPDLRPGERREHPDPDPAVPLEYPDEDPDLAPDPLWITEEHPDVHPEHPDVHPLSPGRTSGLTNQEQTKRTNQDPAWSFQVINSLAETITDASGLWTPEPITPAEYATARALLGAVDDTAWFVAAIGDPAPTLMITRVSDTRPEN